MQAYIYLCIDKWQESIIIFNQVLLNLDLGCVVIKRILIFTNLCQLVNLWPKEAIFPSVDLTVNYYTPNATL